MQFVRFETNVNTLHSDTEIYLVYPYDNYSTPYIMMDEDFNIYLLDRKINITSVGKIENRPTEPFNIIITRLGDIFLYTNGEDVSLYKASLNNLKARLISSSVYFEENGFAYFYEKGEDIITYFVDNVTVMDFYKDGLRINTEEIDFILNPYTFDPIHFKDLTRSKLYGWEFLNKDFLIYECEKPNEPDKWEKFLYNVRTSSSYRCRERAVYDCENMVEYIPNTKEGNILAINMNDTTQQYIIDTPGVLLGISKGILEVNEEYLTFYKYIDLYPELQEVENLMSEFIKDEKDMSLKDLLRAQVLHIVSENIKKDIKRR